jgi:predicted metal-binding membrane protein
MMVAMMLPAATPMILIFAAAQARRDRHVAVPTWIFVAAYIFVWAAAGLVAYVLDLAFTELGSSHASIYRVTWVPLALGITLILAGPYQFTSRKHVCLRLCALERPLQEPTYLTAPLLQQELTTNRLPRKVH